MSKQKRAIQATNDEGRKQHDTHQSELELKLLTVTRLQRQLKDKDEELASAKAKAEVKQEKVRVRLEASAKKLNEVVHQQLTQIVDLKQSNQGLESKIAGLERESFLKEAAGGSTNAFTSKVGNSIDYSQMSLRDMRKEDQTTIDELGDQVKTKEEEIQILWNVIREVNRMKGGNLNLTQLQKLVNRCENAATYHHSSKDSLSIVEAPTLNFATPGHPNGASRY